MKGAWWPVGDRSDWSSGAWSLQLRGDELADIAFAGTVVLRSVRAVVRDRDWATAPLVTDCVTSSDAVLMVHVRSVGLGSSFAGVVRVEVRGESLVVRCDLESQEAFETNRTGLVVLHPPALAGAHATVTHSDGSVAETVYPAAISPHQPVRDIAGLAWTTDAVSVDLLFGGDVFEMEDQRNWTDASFKTYSRPLDLPFPYLLAAGERVRQSVQIRVGRTDDRTVATTDVGVISLDRAGAFPAIGLGAGTAPEPAPDFAPLGSEVLVELDLASSNWRAALERARTARLPLDVRFILDPDSASSLRDGVALLSGNAVRRVSAFHRVSDARHVSDREAVHSLRAALADAGLDIPVVGGSRSHFTELNRELHRLPDDLDGLAVTVTPLFHALGTEQLVESIAVQRLVATQTVSFARGIPVHVGPICLRPRFNDVATGPQPGPRRADLNEGYGAEFTGAVDPRQSAPQLAAWTIASAAALAVPGVASLVWFEEWGPRGIRSPSGSPLPVAEAIDALSHLTGELLWGDSPDGLVWAVGTISETGATVLVANLSGEERPLRIDTPVGAVTTSVAAESFSQHALPYPEEQT